MLGVTNGSELLGGLYLVIDNADPHVGRCMTVAFQYVLPEYRNAGVSRMMMVRAIELTKEYNCAVLAYTHRLGDWRYETVYKRVL